MTNRQIGGLINNTGYLDGTATAGNPYNIIPSGDITMKGVSMPLWATPIKNGKAKKPIMMQPGNNYKFDADFVHEMPILPQKPRIFVNPYAGINEEGDMETGVDARYNFKNGNQIGLDYAIGDKFPSITAKVHFQKGGLNYNMITNSVQQGGNPFRSSKDILSFLFPEMLQDSSQEETKVAAPKAAVNEDTPPSRDEISDNVDDEEYDLATMVAMQSWGSGNPYASSNGSGNPYVPTGKASPEALGTLQDFQPQGFTNLGILPSAQHHLQNPNSDHETGKALDLGVNDLEKGNTAVNQLQTEADKRNIKYIIWNRKIWNPSVSNDWRPYNGKDPHDTHIHISFK